MKKLWQNNLFKLPVFLLLVGIICTVALSLINSVTADKIVENEKTAVLNACKSSFADVEGYGDTSAFVIESVDVSEDLQDVGITGKSVVKSGDVVVGYVYIGTVQGFADQIKFVASYTNGKFHKLKVTYEQETNKKGINYIKNNYVDYDLTSGTNFFETSDYNNGVSGASMTGKKGLITALNTCSEDYLSIYNA